MARVKNEAVRDAILASAASEISAAGYLDTTIGKIARGAGIAPSNVYVYFASKLEIYFAIYETWFKAQFVSLERAVMRQPTPEARIRRLIKGLLHDIAEDRSRYSAALMEALASVQPKDEYRPYLLNWAEDRIAGIIGRATGRVREEDDPRLRAFARLLMLTFDGIALRVKAMGADRDRQDAMQDVEAMLSMLILDAGDGPARSGQNAVDRLEARPESDGRSRLRGR